MRQPDGGGSGSNAKMSGGAIASLTGLGVLVIFMIQNTEDVTLHFLIWDFTWPLWLLHDRRGGVRRDRVVRAGRVAASSSPQGAPRTDVYTFDRILPPSIWYTAPVM